MPTGTEQGDGRREEDRLSSARSPSAPLAEQRLGDPLQPGRPGRLHQHDVARTQLAAQQRRRAAVDVGHVHRLLDPTNPRCRRPSQPGGLLPPTATSLLDVEPDGQPPDRVVLGAADSSPSSAIWPSTAHVRRRGPRAAAIAASARSAARMDSGLAL